MELQKKAEQSKNINTGDLIEVLRRDIVTGLKQEILSELLLKLAGISTPTYSILPKPVDT